MLGSGLIVNDAGHGDPVPVPVRIASPPVVIFPQSYLDPG